MNRLPAFLVALASTLLAGDFTGEAGQQLFSLKEDVPCSPDEVKPWPPVPAAGAKSAVRHCFIEDEHPEAGKRISQTLK